jgi:hypothetical protein
MRGAILPLTQYVLMARCLVKQFDRYSSAVLLTVTKQVYNPELRPSPSQAQNCGFRYLVYTNYRQHETVEAVVKKKKPKEAPQVHTITYFLNWLQLRQPAPSGTARQWHNEHGEASIIRVRLCALNRGQIIRPPESHCLS